METSAQTLEQFVTSLSPAEFARASAALLQGRALPEAEARESLLQELAGYPSIRRRLELIPVRRAAELFSQAVLAGGYLPWERVQSGASVPADAVRPLLEQYFLGTVGVPDWRPIGLDRSGPHLIVFPEVTISWLRNAPPERPGLSALENCAESFMAAIDEALAEAPRGLVVHGPDDRRHFFEEYAREIPYRHPGCSQDRHGVADQLLAIATGERLMERLAQFERRPFHRWDMLADRERCLRVFTHLVTRPEDSTEDGKLRAQFAKGIVQTIRRLEASRWYAPDTIIHLTLLEELREDLLADGRLESSPRGGRGPSAFGELVAGMRQAFYPLLRHSGVLEHAVSGGETVAERLTRDGIAALSPRLDWRHWQKLDRARRAPSRQDRADAVEGAPPADRDTAYVPLQPGQPWEDRLSRFPADVKRLLLATISVPVSPTRKGRLARSQLRELRKLLDWQEDYVELMFDFVAASGLVAASTGLGRYTPSRAAVGFLDGDDPGHGRAVAAFFWQESDDEGPISEDLRELKRVFAQDFLGAAEAGEFARLTAFWDWLSEAPSQQRVANQWRRYVGDDDEALLSIVVSMARTLTWLGMAQVSPDIDQPEFVRLSPAGNEWLVRYRFEERFGAGHVQGKGVKFEEDDRLIADLDLPFQALAEIALFTELVSVADQPQFLLNEGRLRKVVRSGEDPGRFCELLVVHAVESVPPNAMEMLRGVQEESGKLLLQPASGFLRIGDPDLAERIAAGTGLAGLIAARAGEYLILRDDADLEFVLKELHRAGYLVRRPQTASIEEGILSQVRAGHQPRNLGPSGQARAEMDRLAEEDA